MKILLVLIIAALIMGFATSCDEDHENHRYYKAAIDIKPVNMDSIHLPQQVAY